HLRTHARFGSVLGLLLLVNPVLITITTVSVVLRQGGALLDHFGLSTIGLVTPYPGLFTMQQIRQHRRVRNIGRRGHRRVDDLGLAVHSYMGLHPEVPLVAFLRLVHFRIALLLSVFGRGRRMQDRRVHDRAGGDAHSPSLQVQ